MTKIEPNASLIDCAFRGAFTWIVAALRNHYSSVADLLVPSGPLAILLVRLKTVLVTILATLLVTLLNWQTAALKGKTFTIL